MTTTRPTDPAAGLPDRARRAAETYRATDPRTFGTRYANGARWTRRATTAHATALDVPADAVTVTNDTTRAYGISGQYPGDLITVTDPATGRAFPFIPDAHAHGHGWLLLGPCDTCTAPVPVARVATLADLGAALEAPTTDRPPEHDGDPAHHDDCAYARHHTTE